MNNAHGYLITLFYIGGYIAFAVLLAVIAFIVFKFLKRGQ